MKGYKLTTQDGKTRLGEDNETQWGEGIEHVVSGGVPGECGDGWLHAYYSPLAATLLNSVHARIDEPICWECDADVTENLGDKLLCTRIKTIRRVELPSLTSEQRVEIAIHAAMAVYSRSSWVQWAQGWLSKTDRSTEAAWSAVEVATARAATWAAAGVSPAEMASRAAAAAARAAATRAVAWMARVTLAAESVAMAAASAALTEKILSAEVVTKETLLDKIISAVLAGGMS